MSNPLGFATRRENLCSSSMGEVDCGPTWGNFRACCPRGAYCPSTRDPGYYNAECCNEPNLNCTQTILDEGPFCANTSWKMYDNYGYFCCDPALDGFSNGFGVGCANESSYTLSTGQDWLSSTAQQQSKPTDTSSPSASVASSSEPSSLSGGAIAGIVVGCVAAVVLAFLAGWFLMHRTRKRKRSLASHDQSPSSDDPSGNSGQGIIPGSATVMGPQDAKVAHDPSEYPPDKAGGNAEPVELPADSRPSEVLGSPVHPSSFHAEKPG